MVQVKVTDLVPFRMHLHVKLIILFLDELKKGILQSSSALISIRSSFPHELSPPAITAILISASKFLAKSTIGSPLTRLFMELPSCNPFLVPVLELGEIGVGNFEPLYCGVVGMEESIGTSFT